MIELPQPNNGENQNDYIARMIKENDDKPVSLIVREAIKNLKKD